MRKHTSTNQEALMAEALLDIDKMLTRLEKLDESIAAKIAESVKNGANNALGESRQSFLQAMREEGNALKKVGLAAADTIDERLGNRSAQLIALAARLEASVWWYAGVFMVVAFFAGAVGGTAGAWMMMR